MPPKKTSAGDAKPSSTANGSKGKGKASVNSSGTSTPTSSSSKSKSTAPTTAGNEDLNAPKVPTARDIIGGQSWTGKLPQILFYELTVREKWEKPEYTMVSRVFFAHRAQISTTTAD